MLSNDMIQPDQELPEDQTDNVSAENQDSAPASTEEAAQPEEKKQEASAADSPAVESAAEAVAEAPVSEVEEEEAPAVESTASEEESAAPEAEPESSSVEEPGSPESVAELEEATVTSAPEAAETPESPSPEAEMSEAEASEAPAESPEAETGSAEAPVVAEGQASEEAGHSALIAFIDEAVHQPEGLESLLGRATPQELIILVEYFNGQDNVRSNIRRVGLVKRTFDQMQSRMELPSEVQQRFSTALSLFNKKRSEFQAQQEKVREANAEKKAALIEELRKVVEANDMNRHGEVKDIQKSWKETGQVPRDKMDELNLAFRALLDQYYQQRKIHFELLDYDREINLKKKEAILEEMKTIVPPEDKREDREAWEQASASMEAAQVRWKAIGFVPKEELERVMEDYKDVLNQFYNLRREYFESLEQERQENAEAKEELLAKMEEFKAFTSNSPREWNEATQKLRKHQEAWHEIGPAPREVNSDLWKKFREIGDAFYGGKTAFFRQLDDMRAENLDAKTKLVESAESLQESTDWGKTTRRLQELQKEWKKVGPVPERHSQKLWNRFRSACDAFFEAKRDHFAGQREDEKRNLGLKRELIDRVKEVSPDELGGADAAIAEIKAIQEEWKSIGHVPFKEKDKIWDEFRKEVDQFFDDLRANRMHRSVERTRAKVEELPDDARNATLKRQIQAVTRKIEASRRTIEQYENNMGFIAKGKKGDALRQQIEKEVDKERQNMKNLRKELKELRKLKNGELPAEKSDKAPAKEKKEEKPQDEAPQAAAEEAAPEAEAQTEEAPAQENEAETSAEETSKEE